MEESVLVDKWTGKDKEDRHTVLISNDLFFLKKNMSVQLDHATEGDKLCLS